MKKTTENLVHVGGRMQFCPSEIVMFKADLNYTIIYLQNGRSILSSTNLGKIANRVKDFAFYQPNRSYIINLDFIKNFENETSQIQMQNEEKVMISRRKLKAFTMLDL
jgi:DNA-binding LytR/AlgR family response regulator